MIENWQQKAKLIVPPENTGILASRGGLLGPAFFPEGLGLQNPCQIEFPDIVAIGHNFGCEDYRNEIEAAGREDDKATWRNLIKTLSDAHVKVDSCYMTNWFVGLQPGDKQIGEFLLHPHPRFEADCQRLLMAQLEGIRPAAILLLGLPIVNLVHKIMPALRPWSTCSNWREVDRSVIGPVAYGVKIPGTEVKVNVVALLHPSFSPSNQRHRRSLYSVPKPEVEMICKAIEGLPISAK